MTQRGRQRRVNQKLSYARWHVAWVDQVARDGQQRAALLESAVWHALGAYRCFLGEIAADVHVTPDQPLIDTVSAVNLAKAYSDYLPAALAECANLEGQSGWLQDLLRWADYSARTDEEPVAPTAGLDVISSSAGASTQPVIGEVTHCLEQLEQLIERLRDDMLEY